PSLWRDVLQKLRAHGHNAVTVPVAWNYHSPAPGEHDFSGVRDLDLFLRTAAEERLYGVLRPGPHLGADLDAGGLPGWLTATGVTARSDDPEYLRHADAWLGAVNSVAVRHLYTAGRGTVLLYQLEDARDAAPAEARAATERLYARLRADRIDVPVFRTGGTPDAAGEPWLYAVDTAPDRGPADPVRLAGGAASRPRTPPGARCSAPRARRPAPASRGGTPRTPRPRGCPPARCASRAGPRAGRAPPASGRPRRPARPTPGAGRPPAARATARCAGSATRPTSGARRSPTSPAGSPSTTPGRRSAAPPGAGCPGRTSTPPTTTARPSTRPAASRPSWPRCSNWATCCGPCRTSPGSTRRRRSARRTTG